MANSADPDQLADLELHCLQRQGISGLSRTRVNAVNAGVIFSVEDILKSCSEFTQKTGFDISWKLSTMKTICMKCQILFSGVKKKNIINLKCGLLTLLRQ